MESHQIRFTIYNKNVSDFVYVCFLHILFAALVLISLEILVNARKEITSLSILNFRTSPVAAFVKSLRPTLPFSPLLDIRKNYNPLLVQLLLFGSREYVLVIFKFFLNYAILSCNFLQMLPTLLLIYKL